MQGSGFVMVPVLMEKLEIGGWVGSTFLSDIETV